MSQPREDAERERGLRRGNMLWEGSRMFLPEHKAALRAYRQQQRTFQMPVLGPDQLQKIDHVIGQALDADCAITITYAGTTEPQQVYGHVIVMPQAQCLVIAGQRIPFKRILDAE